MKLAILILLLTFVTNAVASIEDIGILIDENQKAQCKLAQALLQATPKNEILKDSVHFQMGHDKSIDTAQIKIELKKAAYFD